MPCTSTISRLLSSDCHLQAPEIFQTPSRTHLVQDKNILCSSMQKKTPQAEKTRCAFCMLTGARVFAIPRSTQRTRTFGSFMQKYRSSKHTHSCLSSFFCHGIIILQVPETHGHVPELETPLEDFRSEALNCYDATLARVTGINQVCTLCSTAPFCCATLRTVPKMKTSK